MRLAVGDSKGTPFKRIRENPIRRLMFSATRILDLAGFVRAFQAFKNHRARVLYVCFTFSGGALQTPVIRRILEGDW
jgi:hypothetical protein